MSNTSAVRDKAKELVEKFWNQIYYNAVPVNWNSKLEGNKDNLMLMQAKKCAIICVDEIIAEVSPSIYRDGRNGLNQEQYWKQVKKEITKL